MITDKDYAKYLAQNEVKIEVTINKINYLIDNPDKDFKAHEVMQLSQSALNLANVAATLNNMDKKS